MALPSRVDLGYFTQKSKQLLDFLYPPLCLGCGEEVTQRALCPACFNKFNRITGTKCHSCALPLMGEADEGVYCDFCLSDTPPWDQGAAVALYEGTARRMVLALKHGDRLDLRLAMAQWMGQSASELPKPDIVLPVPLHWRRLLRRKYNQALELARPIAAQYDCKLVPDALYRTTLIPMQKTADRQQRIKSQQGSVIVHRNHKHHIAGKSILLVDDVMTTGATLRACAQACWQANCKSINILVFARVASGIQSDIV